jgi:TonB family protein
MMEKEQTAGMAGSLLFHGLLAILLFFWTIAEPSAPPEFVEVLWGSSAALNVPGAGSAGSAPAAASASPALPGPAETPVTLPSRRSTPEEELLSVPRREKLDVGESGRRGGGEPARNAELDRDRPRSEGRDVPVSGRGTEATGSAGEKAGPGSSAGSGVSMAMEWSGGGTRRKVSGDLPAYPQGETAETQIRIEAVVTPAGRVTGVRPVQKGNARLEEAAMKEVRRWVFEPLPPTVSQNTQLCIITFNFRLR